MRVETNISTPIVSKNENIETPKKLTTSSTLDRGVNKVAPTTPKNQTLHGGWSSENLLKATPPSIFSALRIFPEEHQSLPPWPEGVVTAVQIDR